VRAHADQWLVNFALGESIPSPFHVNLQVAFLYRGGGGGGGGKGPRGGGGGGGGRRGGGGGGGVSGVAASLGGTVVTL